MNEFTTGSMKLLSLSMGNLMGNMEGGGHLPETLRERCRRKFRRRAPLALGACRGTCGVVHRVFLEGSRRGASLSVGALLGEFLLGIRKDMERRAEGMDITPWGSINREF